MLATDVLSIALLFVTVFPTPVMEVIPGESRLLLWLFLGGLIVEKGVVFHLPPFMMRYAGIAVPAVPLFLFLALWTLSYPVDPQTPLDIVLHTPGMLLAWLAGVGLKRLIWKGQLGADAYKSYFSAAAPHLTPLIACVLATVIFGLTVFAIATVVFGPEVLQENLSTLMLIAVFPVLLVFCTDFGGSSNPTVPQGIEDSPAETLASQTHMSHDSV